MSLYKVMIVMMMMMMIVMMMITVMMMPGHLRSRGEAHAGGAAREPELQPVHPAGDQEDNDDDDDGDDNGDDNGDGDADDLHGGYQLGLGPAVSRGGEPGLRGGRRQAGLRPPGDLQGVRGHLRGRALSSPGPGGQCRVL